VSSPLKIFDIARSEDRFVYASAPMVRYSKLAFRQTVHEYGTDLTWTPMILSKEFNRSAAARDSDFTTSTRMAQPPTIVQFGASSPVEFSRAASLVMPYANGVDLNCGCPQTWACAASLGAALMEKRHLVRDILVETRGMMLRDGWQRDKESRSGRSLSVKIRIHKDLRKTVDFLNTVIGDPQAPLVDFVTIHPRSRRTPSNVPIDTEALRFLASQFGHKIPILLSGDVFTLKSVPVPTLEDRPGGQDPTPSTTNITGLMSARAILTNPALFAGYDTCPWNAVEAFMRNAVRSPLPLRLVLHHLSEMCGPGPGENKGSLLNRRERGLLLKQTTMLDVIDFVDQTIMAKTGQPEGAWRT
ncbi:hypothetical protein jhhlp_002220, partial [Lomentospora prolificans]